MKKIKTELILEVAKNIKNTKGFDKSVKKLKYGIKKTSISLIDEEIAKKIQREIGQYISFDFNELLFFDIKAKELLCTELEKSIKEIVAYLKVKTKKVLIVGLGNEKYACDRLGKSVVDKVLITKPYLDRNLFDAGTMNEIYAVSIGVYGTTGLESLDTIKSICNQISPDLVVVVDSMVAMDTKRLSKSIQISDTKLCPGGGVGNNRKEISEKTLGAKLIAIGVPLVVNLSSLCNANEDLIVTPKDVEQNVETISKIISKAINLSFNKLTEKQLYELTM